MHLCCFLMGLMAAALASDETVSTVSLTADDWVPAVVNSSSGSSDEPHAEALIAPAAAEDRMDTNDYHYDVGDYEDSEYLPDPEALVDGQDDDDEVVVLDDETRIVAEALIQELDNIGSKLNNDDDTVSASPLISPVEVKQLEEMLESAGLTPNSPTLQHLMSQRQNAIPAEDILGPGMGGLPGLTHVISGDGIIKETVAQPQSLASIPPLTTGLTKRNIEDIKRELKHMLFGSDEKRQVIFSTFYSCFDTFWLGAWVTKIIA